MTDDQQPLDISTNRPFKAYIQREFVSWFAALSPQQRLTAGSLPVLKQNCVKWVVEAASHIRDIGEHSVEAGWEKAGLLAAFSRDVQERARGRVTEADCAAVPTPRTFLSEDQIARVQALVAASAAASPVAAAAAAVEDDISDEAVMPPHAEPSDADLDEQMADECDDSDSAASNDSSDDYFSVYDDEDDCDDCAVVLEQLRLGAVESVAEPAQRPRRTVVPNRRKDFAYGSASE
jgi:hypothetical protein